MQRKDRIKALLKSIETGDPAAIAVVDESRYVQHNPQTAEGGEGLVALFQRLAKRSPRVNVVRAFEDGDYVFAHTEYDFGTRRIGFEIFRFDGDHAVEHWDNIQARQGPNPSGHSMVDGPTDAQALDSTEQNRTLAGDFVTTVLIAGQLQKLDDYVHAAFVEHNPTRRDGLASLREWLVDNPSSSYQVVHRILAEGNFVLCVSEGNRAGEQTAFYDLFRLQDAMIVEHWDTTETVAPRSEWKNDNGKF